MNLIEHSFGDSNFIKEYKNNQIFINDKIYDKPFLLSADSLTAWHGIQFINHKLTLQEESISDILFYQPNIVLIGTGNDQHFINPKIIAPILDQQIGVEFMSTRLACQTFNVLLSEGRSVVAGLIP